MPKVPERKLSYGEDLDKLRRLQRSKETKPGTKQFATHSYKEPHKGSKHGAIKTTRRPARAIDPTISQYHDKALRGFYKSL